MLYSRDPSRYLVTSEPTLQGGRLKVASYFKVVTRCSSCSISSWELPLIYFFTGWLLPRKTSIISYLMQWDSWSFSLFPILMTQWAQLQLFHQFAWAIEHLWIFPPLYSLPGRYINHCWSQASPQQRLPHVDDIFEPPLPSKNRIIGICIQDVRPMQGHFDHLQTCTCFLPDQLNSPTRTRCLTSHNNHPVICYFWS